MSIRKVALGSTFYFLFTTRQYSDGAPTALLGTPDLSVIEENSATVLPTTTDDSVTVTTGHASVAGLNLGKVSALAADGFEAGKHYTVYIDTGTVGGTSAVGEVVYEFQIETATELAQRVYAEKMYPTHVLNTQTGVSDGTKIKLTDIVPAGTSADELKGEILTVWDAGATFPPILVRVTAFAVTTLLATVEQLDGSAMPFTAAAGDLCWRTGQYTADTVKANSVPIYGIGTSGNKWRGTA